MARTRSSYTASPSRFRSPQRSPARHPSSEDGSQYEMDLDALGLNSTFDSTGLDEHHEPRGDVVDTSDIEGPEDFTMNMTYWMTADLPLSQIRSRKEAGARAHEIRHDAPNHQEEEQEATDEDDRAVLEESTKERDEEEFNSASPTMRANGTNEERPRSRASVEEPSMENDEKVRSYLSALPDGVLTSTPSRVPKQNMLQVPSPAPRPISLQATVEDYDTPTRKPTQETVIHHVPERPTEIIDTAAVDSLHHQIAELNTQLEQQRLASHTRITELETILSYTRSDLETTRMDNYRQKERVSALEKEGDTRQREVDEARASVDARLKAQEEELQAKMQEYGEELRLQNLAKLQNQREEFEGQIQALEESKRSAEEESKERNVTLERVRGELSQLRESHARELQGVRNSQPIEHEERDFDQERNELQEKLTEFQSRASTLQADLEKATAEAKAAREEVQANELARASFEASIQTKTSCITDLESQLRTAQAELEASKSSSSTTGHLVQHSPDLESRIESLQSQLEESRADIDSKNQELAGLKELQARVQSLQSQLDSARAEAANKDRTQMRHIEEQELSEQRHNIAQGRIEGLETTISTLRQQLAETHRHSAKGRTDVERVEAELEDANERLRDARAEADRRVADMDKKLTNMKEAKIEAESRFMQLQSQHDDLSEDHEAKLEDVRSNAEDAVRKAGALLEQERAEKKKLVRDLKKTSGELEQLRSEAAQKTQADDDEAVSNGSSNTTSSSTASSLLRAKDTEIENLRTLLRKQASELKTLKTETVALRKKQSQQQQQQQHPPISTTTQTALSDTADAADLETLRITNAQLTTENTHLNTLLTTQQADHAAVNAAMDEKLAAMLSQMVKERARNVVSKRDGQWKESVGKVKEERELMGRMLMREWGRQEVGVAEHEGEKGDGGRTKGQGYRYRYVKRGRGGEGVEV